MREKVGKFRKAGAQKRKPVVLNKSDKDWLTKNTHFDPENISEWFKVRGRGGVVGGGGGGRDGIPRRIDSFGCSVIMLVKSEV